MHIESTYLPALFLFIFFNLCLLAYLAAQSRALHAGRIRLAGDDGEAQPQKPQFPRLAIAPILFLSISGLVVQISMLVHGINWHNRWESNTFIWWFMQVFFITAHSFLLIHSVMYPNIVTITNTPFSFPKITFKSPKSLVNPAYTIQTVGFFMAVLPIAASITGSHWYNSSMWNWRGGFRTYYVPTRLQLVIGVLYFIVGTVYHHVYADGTDEVARSEESASSSATV